MLDRACQKMIKFQCYKFYRFSIKKNSIDFQPLETVPLLQDISINISIL